MTTTTKKRHLLTADIMKRAVIDAFVGGERTSEVARRFGVTPGRVAQLRRKYEALWRTFQGEPVAASRVA